MQILEAQQSGQFICVRLPPVPAGIPIQTVQGLSINVMTFWPRVTKNDFCGMYETNQKGLLS
jgi:hypothetical protein